MWGGEGRERHLPGSEGHRAGKSEVSSLFGFWSKMSKNVKDPTDRHWNMNFFFSLRETDRRGWKKRQLLRPHLLLSCLKLPPSLGPGIVGGSRTEEGDGWAGWGGVGGTCES